MKPTNALSTVCTLTAGHNALAIGDAQNEHVCKAAPNSTQNKKQNCVERIKIRNQAKSRFLKTKAAANKKKTLQAREMALAFKT
jgi:hypothetical protein